MIDTGYWILDASCWMLDAGKWGFKGYEIFGLFISFKRSLAK